MKCLVAVLLCASCLVGEANAAAKTKQVIRQKTVTRGAAVVQAPVLQAPVLQQTTVFRQRSFGVDYGVASQASFAPSYQVQAQFAPVYQAPVLMQAPVYAAPAPVVLQAPVVVQQAPVYVQQAPIMLQAAPVIQQAPVYQAPQALQDVGPSCATVPGAQLQFQRQRGMYR